MNGCLCAAAGSRAKRIKLNVDICSCEDEEKEALQIKDECFAHILLFLSPPALTDWTEGSRLLFSLNL